MAIVVEHDKRKKEILEKALDVFSEEGYEDVTFQKIADRCGITRTTLYIYFKNKREIFLWSIKQMMSGLEEGLVRLCSDESVPPSQALLNILTMIMENCELNKRLFGVILDYLLQMKKSGGNPREKVRRRVVHLRHLLSQVIIRGINSGEFKKINVRSVNELFYSIIESAIFRLAVLNQDDLAETRLILKFTVDDLLAQ
ncbi:TetR/AcrR family transcriptional regulator [Treponema parvum]|uniref:TetR/AcrR family transcriptional regulator n=1 Tax=Treponema parvum TaxID=138851 RepID=UPI001AEC049D|nr:TetR/AcrR family transcriptional regulator [Treponema parvum]QTQ17071.1 TetR/AcrR family transcriptional regulator [Treponema parvum]